MKFVSTAVVALALSFAASAFAADPAAKTLTPQQQRMKDCNTQASGMKGDERRAFMSTCLKGGTAHAATAQPTGATAQTAASNAPASASPDKKKAHRSSATAH